MKVTKINIDGVDYEEVRAPAGIGCHVCEFIDADPNTQPCAYCLETFRTNDLYLFENIMIRRIKEGCP